jgi:serine/threonine protein kinase
MPGADEQTARRATTATATQDGQVIGEFRVDAKLGEGAMGVVYKAHQITMDRPVALKVLAAHLTANPEFVQRFRREAQMSAKLDHPNVVRGITVGQDKGLHYFAMEFVDGENLSDILARRGRLTISDAARITLDVARALAQAEKRGIVHRDIKPANVMLTRDGVVKLADLGLAKVTTDTNEITVTGAFFGTPPYMAPEQFRTAREVDIRSDIYSLGATLYLLVTGEKPFKGSAYECLTMKERREWKPASHLNSQVPEVLDRIIARTLEPNPSDRYASAAELVADLEASGLVVGDLTLQSGATGSPATKAIVVRSPATTVVEQPSPPPRVRAPLLAVFAFVVVVGLFVARPWIERMLSEPAPPPAPIQSVISTRVSRVLTRAYGEIALGDLEEARRVLRRGLEHHPTSAALQGPLRELDQGALVLFQYQTQEETLPLAPIEADRDLTLTQSDNYRFAFVTTRPCFLYAFQLDERPSVSTVFPNANVSSLENPVSEGKVHWLPDSDSSLEGSWLHLDDFKGTERIFFVGLSRPLHDPQRFGERLLADSRATVDAVTRSPGDFVSAGAPSVEPCFGDAPVQELHLRHG